MMFNKKNIFVFVIALTVLMGILFVNSTLIGVPQVNAPTNHTNFSTTFNDTINLNASFPQTADTNQHIMNVTFAWSNTSHSYIYNTTIHNTTLNQSSFLNSSFNMSLLAEGTYNLSVFARNRSGDLSTFNTTIVSLIIDNTVPQVVNLTPPTNINLTNTSSFNVTFNATILDSGAGLKNVTFQFDNATGIGFNMIAHNTTGFNVNGLWNVSINGSFFHGGTHTITVIATDYAGNVNDTETITFYFNNAPNVTVDTLTQALDKNFSIRSSNQTFNATIKVINRSSTWSHSTSGVYFAFDNASGTGFNVTAINNNPTFGKWSLNYNVSTLAHGRHVVTIHANDTINNINSSENFTFFVDFQAPNVTNLLPGNSPNYTINTNNISFGVQADDSLAIANVTVFLTSVGNITANNYSGVWNISYNVSSLRGSPNLYYVKFFVNDSTGNMNQSTRTLNFSVNTPLNISALNSPAEMRNFTVGSSNQIFNITITNGTWRSGLTRVTQNVSFQFDNGNGTPFNVSARNSTYADSTKSGVWNITYNVSSLTDGQYVVTIFSNDSFGNVNNTQKINFSVDNGYPVIAVTCNNAAKGGTVTCSCTATDAVSGILNTLVFTDTTPSTSTVGDFETETCSATDFANHTSTGVGVYTITAGSSGGSGSSGSSGGTSSGSAGVSSKKVWASINAGETATVAVENGAIGITEVSFKLSETVYGGWAQVLRHDSLPSSVKSFAGKTYRNLEITTGNALKAEAVTDRVIKFKVETDWLKDNALTSTNVALYHYTGNQWVELSTNKGEDDGTYVHYTATTPGFSYFVIGEKVGAPTVEATKETTEATSEGTSAPTESTTEAPEESGSPVWVWIALAVILVVAGVWYWMRRN